MFDCFLAQAIWTTLNLQVTPRKRLEEYLVRMSKWLSTQPAKIIGFDNRGSIAKGKLADLIVWDPYCKNSARPIDEYEDVSPYTGLELYGKIHCVFLQGHLAYNNGVFSENGNRMHWTP